jgi:isopenicillin-N epimerase
MYRRDFLVRTGLALGAAVLTAHAPFSRVLAGEGQGKGKGEDKGRPQPRQLDSWEEVRGQFLLSREFIHMTGFLLASHPLPVREAIERHRQGLDENPAHYWSDNEERFEAEVLAAAADYLGANATDIALTDSTTMGLGLLYGGLNLRRDQEILTTGHDHYSTEISLLHRAERTGAAIRTIPLYRDLATVSKGEIVEALVKQVKPQTRIVAVTWVHSSTGLKLPIAEMAAALAGLNADRPEGDRALLCVDGVHGIGVEDVVVEELGCDFFIAGCHKWLFGPRGTGLVWGHPRAWPVAQPVIPTFNMEAYRIWMREIPQKEVVKAALMTPGGFHSFEHRWALSQAFRFHRAIGKLRVAERIHELNDQLKAGLAAMPHVALRTPRARDLSAGIVCLEIAGWKPHKVVEHLRRRRIIASVTPYAVQYLRLAPSLLTSPEDVDKTLAEIRALKTKA